MAVAARFARVPELPGYPTLNAGPQVLRLSGMGSVTKITETQFSVGELVHHRLFDYRGVIVDVDPDFQATEEWYEAVARSRPPKDRPWYHVLVDGSTQSTYVAERNLEPDTSREPISHPMLEHFFSSFENGRYHADRTQAN